MKTKRVMMLAVIVIMSITAKSNLVEDVGHLVTATKYHPVKNQCYGNPLITADGSKINLSVLKSGKIRWIAVSRDLLNYYNYGDTVIVMTDNKKISGRWIIHDTMSSRYKKRIDFLLHPSHTHDIPRQVKIYPA